MTYCVMQQKLSGLPRARRLNELKDPEIEASLAAVSNDFRSDPDTSMRGIEKGLEAEA